jgi:hypothetical protein
MLATPVDARQITQTPADSLKVAPPTRTVSVGRAGGRFAAGTVHRIVLAVVESPCGTVGGGVA